MSERTFAVVLGGLLVTLNLVALALVLSQRSDIVHQLIELAGEHGKVEAEKAKNAAAEVHMADINRQIDMQVLAMDRQRTEQRDLDQRKRERDDAVTGSDDARHAQRGAEAVRDKAQADAQGANTNVAVAREAVQILQSETGRLATMKSSLQIDVDRLQRDKQSADSAFRKSDDDRKSADAQTQQSSQGREEARRVLELTQRERDTTRDAATGAKLELTSLEARRSDTTAALQRLTERRQTAAVAAETEEARLKKANDTLTAQQTTLSGGQQREDDLRKRLQTAQTSVADAEARRLSTSQELGTLQGQLSQVQAQLTAEKADQIRLATLQAQIGPATQQLTILQQQQTALHADIQSLQSQKAGVTKAQADLEAFRAEIRILTANRNQLNMDLGQRAQLDKELQAVAQSIGQQRAQADQATTARQKALDDRAVLERERMDLAAQLPLLRSQRDALKKERDMTAEQAAKAQAELGSMLRERDAAEQEVVRLRTLGAGLATLKTLDATHTKQEAP